MIAFAQPGLLELLGASYLVAGGVVVWRLGGRLGWAGTVGAFAAWPVFLPLLTGPTERPGPHGARIHEVFAALERTLTDPAAEEVPWSADLGGLREALSRADERIGLVDRLLADAGPAPTGTLRQAREAAAGELLAVLDEVVQLRLQIGLAALHGNAASVRERLSELLARAEAIDEVTGLHG
ncbi:MAG: hypothetical protein R3F61_23320 [Myxococcota bacterium]